MRIIGIMTCGVMALSACGKQAPAPTPAPVAEAAKPTEPEPAKPEVDRPVEAEKPAEPEPAPEPVVAEKPVEPTKAEPNPTQSSYTESWTAEVDNTHAYGKGVASLPDGGVLVVGAMLEPGNYRATTWRFSKSGELAQEKSYPESEVSGFERALAIGGKVLVAGRLDRGMGAGSDAWFGVLEADGSVAWRKKYGAPESGTFVNFLVAHPDGKTAYAGIAINKGAATHTKLVALELDGTESFDKDFGDHFFFSGFDADQQLVVNRYTKGQGGALDRFRVTLDAGNATIISDDAEPGPSWEAVLGPVIAGENILTADGGRVAASSPMDHSSRTLTRLDGKNDKLWSTVICPGSECSVDGLANTASGGFVALLGLATVGDNDLRDQAGFRVVAME